MKCDPDSDKAFHFNNQLEEFKPVIKKCQKYR